MPDLCHLPGSGVCRSHPQHRLLFEEYNQCFALASVPLLPDRANGELYALAKSAKTAGEDPAFCSGVKSSSTGCGLFIDMKLLVVCGVLVSLQAVCVTSNDYL